MIKWWVSYNVGTVNEDMNMGREVVHTSLSHDRLLRRVGCVLPSVLKA